MRLAGWRGDWGSFEAREAQAAIRRAVEPGVMLFDTAQAHGFGAPEQVLGEALKPELIRSRRDSIVVATKGGLRMERDMLLRDVSAN